MTKGMKGTKGFVKQPSKDAVRLAATRAAAASARNQQSGPNQLARAEKGGVLFVCNNSQKI